MLIRLDAPLGVGRDVWQVGLLIRLIEMWLPMVFWNNNLA